MSRRADKVYHSLVLALALGMLVAARMLSIRGDSGVVLPWIGWPLPQLCAMQRTLGMSCPGCGLTRCFIALAHGDWRSAWHYNPAGLLLFALVVFQIPWQAAQLWRIRRGLPELWPGRVAAAVFGVFVLLLFGQWILRVGGIAL
jgi:hypothetical protein